MVDQVKVAAVEQEPTEQSLRRNLTNRHIQLIAIGGAIGTGLFMGSGKTISLAGPSIIFVYMIIGFMLFFVMRAMGELLLSNLEYKSFSDFAADLLGPWAGYFTGWTYWFCWVVTGMADVVAITAYAQFWFPGLSDWVASLAVILLLLGLNLATETGADLMLATDPDADRVGIAMKCPDGSYELVSGNEMGVLLLDYICAGRIEKGTMPKNPVAVKSIVSTPLADAVAKHYGVEMRNVLTGFKWIGDQIANLEAAGEVDRFIFGFEESYGYLAGPYVRDKDAVIGSMLICEMAAYYRSIGSSIKQRLEEIYAQYGRYLNKVDSFEFPGLTGMEKMASIMQKLRDQPPVELAGHKVVKVTDYKKPEETGLPAANVLIYTLENGATVVVRPSGTEPKIKTYFTTLGKDLAEAQAQKDALAAAIEPILK